MTRTEKFKARVQVGMRVQIPRVIRWKHKLKPGTVLHVEVSTQPLRYERFYAVMRKDGRLSIPKLYADALELGPGKIVTVEIKIPKNSFEKTVFRTMLKTPL